MEQEEEEVMSQISSTCLTNYLVKLIFKNDVEYDYDRFVVIVVVKHGGKILYLHIWPSRYLSRRLVHLELIISQWVF